MSETKFQTGHLFSLIVRLMTIINDYSCIKSEKAEHQLACRMCLLRAVY